MQYIIPVLLIIVGLISVIKPEKMVEIDRRMFRKNVQMNLEQRKKVARITGVLALVVGIITFII